MLEHFYRLRLETYEQELESNERELLFRADSNVITPRHQVPSEKGKDTLPQVKSDPTPPPGLSCWWIIEDAAVQTQNGRRARRTQICMDPTTNQVSIHQTELF